MCKRVYTRCNALLPRIHFFFKILSSIQNIFNISYFNLLKILQYFIGPKTPTFKDFTLPKPLNILAHNFSKLYLHDELMVRDMLAAEPPPTWWGDKGGPMIDGDAV